MRRANFHITRSTPNMLLLTDLGPWDVHPTITNDAEHVVQILAPSLHGKRIFYYDSERELTELHVRNGVFDGFGPADEAFIQEEMRNHS